MAQRVEQEMLTFLAQRFEKVYNEKNKKYERICVISKPIIIQYRTGYIPQNGDSIGQESSEIK